MIGQLRYVQHSVRLEGLEWASDFGGKGFVNNLLGVRASLRRHEDDDDSTAPAMSTWLRDCNNKKRMTFQ